MIPTFDEWYVRKHGRTFEQLYQLPGESITRAMRELSRALREYTSEMVRATAFPPA